MRLAYTRLVTRDVPGLAEFYAWLLQLPSMGSDQYVEIVTGDCKLSIVSKQSVDLFSAGAAEPATNQSVILDFEVEDVDREFRRLQGMISEFVLTPIDQPWGNRSMLFRDPDGNLINFFTPRSSCRVVKAF
jgi:uncharacterized glyoxalase superfamily protein PhnB